ncbi:hypothetical protein [Streptomyces scopuliridis]
MQLVRALAERFPGQPLRLDPNGAWSVETSLKVADELSWSIWRTVPRG